jgi:hypothetical protein
VLGPWALLVFAAGVGAALALSAEEAGTRWAGLKFLIGGMLVALLLTGPAVWAVQHYTEVPANIAFIPIAFALGLYRSGVVEFIRKVFDAVAAGIGTFLNAAANRRGSGK